ncbi:MAG: MarR family transcriptional regulator [Anaerolineae bacterium]|nr:MarR family transcriptional regulator [Anaerolineae bacterium]
MAPIAYQDLGRLLVSVCRLHHTRADQSMEKIGLYRGQARLLMTLAAQDGMTHSEVAERLQISAPAATKVIQRMEEAEYVQRRADPADERVSRVYLREKGRALTDQINAAFGTLDRTMFAGQPDVDLERLRDLLTRMHANLQGFQP